MIDPDSGEDDMDVSVKKYLDQSMSSDSDDDPGKKICTEEVAPFEDNKVSLEMGPVIQTKGALQSLVMKQVNYEANVSPLVDPYSGMSHRPLNDAGNTNFNATQDVGDETLRSI